nr:putative retrotransposon Ty1-copia subclass protein [Tanacetum cinerariifolium]
MPIPINAPLDTSNDHLIAQDHPNNVEETEPNPEINVEPQETQHPLRRSQRNRQPTNFDDYYTYLNEADFDLEKCNDPESFEDAITCDQSAHLREAMEDELNSMRKTTFENLLNYQRVQNPLDASGSSRPNLTQMEILSDTKLVWLRKGTTTLVGGSVLPGESSETLVENLKLEEIRISN